MSYEEERVVKLTFDNESFKKGVADTIVALRNLEKQLDIDPKAAARSFDNLTQSVYSTEKELGNLEGCAEKVKIGFSALEVVGITVFANLTTAAMQFGRSLFTNTIGQIQSGGLSRALNLENAKFQLEGLDQEWKTIKDDILYGVKDTAYGLDEAARVASQLVASNIEVGESMQISLRAISGVAAMTNSSYSDIGQIFTTMAAQGKVMGHELTRLSYRGLNVAAAIAKYNEKIQNSALDTEAKVREAASKGKISYQEFANAMFDQFGKHAAEANKTFTGAMSNMRAALSRLGEAFQSPTLDFRRRVAVSVIPAIDMIASALNKSAVPVFTKILDMIASWTEKLFDSYDFLKFIYNVVVGIYSWIHNIIRALWELGLVAPDVKDLARSLADMSEWMVLSGDRAEKFRNVIKMLAKGFQTLLMVIDAIVYVMEPIFKPVLDFLKNTVSSVGDAAGASQDVFDKIQNVIKAIAIIMRMGMEKVIPKIVRAIKILIGSIQLMALAIGAISYIIIKVVKAFFNFQKNVAIYIAHIVKNCKWLRDAVIAVYEVIRQVIINAGKGIKNLIEVMTTSTGALWDKISGLFSNKTVKVNVVADTSKAVSAYSDYSSAAKEAQKSGEKANSGFTIKGGAGGPFQGAFGGDSGDFWQDVRDRMGEVDDETKDVDKSMNKLADGFSSGFTKIDDELDKSSVFGEDENFATHFAERMNSVMAATQGLATASPFVASIANIILGSSVILTSTLEVVFEGITKILVSASKAIPEIAEGLTDGLIRAFKTLNNSLPDLLKEFGIALDSFNFWDVLKAIVLVNLLVGALFKLSLATRIADPTFFNSMALTILAFGAVLATIGAIAKFVDNKSLKIVFIGAGVVAGILTLFMTMLTIFSAIKKFTDSTSNFLKGLTKAIKDIKLINVNVNKRMQEFGEVLKDLAILCGVLLGFAVGIMIYLDKFGTENSFKNLMKAGILIVTMIYAVVGLVALVVGVLGDKSGTKSVSDFTWKLKGGMHFKNDLNTAMVGLTAMLTAISVFTAVISSAVMALSFRDFDKVAKIFGLLIGSFVSMLLMVSGFVIYLTESVLKKGNFWTNDERIPEKMGIMMKSISLFVLVIAKMVVGFSAAAMVLDQISESKLTKITKTFGVIFVGVLALMYSYVGAMQLMSKIKMNGTSTKSMLILTIFLTSFMTVMSSLMFVIAKAVSILSGSNANTIGQSAAIIGVMMLGVVGLFVGIMALANRLSSVKPEKAAALTVTVSNMAAVLGILVGAISSIVTVTIIMAKVIDGLTDITSVIVAIGIIGGIFVALSGFYVLINKTANLMPSVQSVYGLALLSVAMTTMIMGIAGFMKVISTIDLDGKIIAVTISAIVIALLSMVALSKFVSGKALVAIASGWKGLLVIVGLIAAIAGGIALIGRAIGYVGENISIMANSFKEIANVPWDAISNSSAAMKTAVKNVVDAISVSLGVKSVVGLLILSSGLESMTNAVKGLSKLQPEQLTGFAIAIKMILETLADSWQGALIAVGVAMLFQFVGWSLALGMAGFIIFAALVPTMVKTVNAAISALAGLAQLPDDIDKYSKTIDQLIPLAGRLAVFGVLLAVGGTSLALGAAGLLAGLWILQKTSEIMTSDYSNIELMIAYLGGFMTVAFYSVLDGWLLSSGAGMLAIGAILMIAAVGILKGVYKIMQSDFSKLKAAVNYLQILGALGVAAIVASVPLLLGSALLSIASLMFLVACGSLALSLFALQKAFEYVDFDLLTIGLEDLGGICVTLGEVGAMLSVGMIPFVEGTALLALAMLGFMVAGVELLVGATTFGLGLVALSKAFQAVDIKIITNNIEAVIEFTALLAGIGTVMSIALIPFTIAAALFSLAAGMIGAGIVLFTGSLLIGSAMILGAMYILEPAFAKMFEVFDTVGFLDILGVCGKLVTLGIGVIIAGAMLSLGGIPFLIGTALLLAGAAIISLAMDKLGAALELKRMLKIIGSMTLLIASVMIFAIISPILIIAGLAFITFAAALIVGAAIISTVASIISEGISDVEDLYDDFYDAAEYIIDGIIDGLVDRAEEVIDEVADFAEEVLDTFCDTLGIHSPAEEFIKAAANIIAGIAEGLGMDHDEVYDQIYTTGMGMLDTFGGFTEGFADIGEMMGLTGGNSLIDGLANGTIPGMEDLMNQLGDSWGAGLSGIFGMGSQAMIDEATKWKNYYDDLASDAAQSGLYDLAATYSQQAAEYRNQITELEKQKSIFEWEPESADSFVSDFKWGGGGSDLTSPETTEALAEAGKDTGGANNLAKTTGSNVGNTVNNNYNFIQNNYSPEPIDRTELYTQTQNQLDSWYKYVRDYN